MVKLRLLYGLGAITLIISVIFWGQVLGDNSPDIDEYYYENHAKIRVPPLSSEKVSDFEQHGFDVARLNPDGSRIVIATSRDREKLISVFGGEVIIENLEEFYRSRLDPTKVMGGYHTYSETIDTLTTLHDLYPALTRLDTIGYSLEGRAVVAFKISDNAEIDESDEPEVQFNGLIHAREPMGLEICLTTIDYLLSNVSDPEVEEMVNSTEIWFVPIINPDGYVYNETTNPEGGGMWRKNRRDNGDGSFGIDLNRNWGFNWAAYGNSSWSGVTEIYHGTGPFSEPETALMSDFIDAHDFTIIVNYHSYGNVYIIPMGVELIYGCPDDAVIIPLFSSAAFLTGYDLGSFGGGVVGFGGDAACWQYADQTNKRKVFSVLIEVGTEFWPDASERDEHCQLHLQSNLQLIGNAHNLHIRPTRYLQSEFTFFDSTISDCSEPFSKLFTFYNTHPTMPMEVISSYSNVSYPTGACIPSLFSGTVDPGDSFTVSFDFDPSTMFGAEDGYMGQGTYDLTILTTEGQQIEDVLQFVLRMRYMADFDDGDDLMACLDNCPYDYNPGQADDDEDGVGNACDNCLDVPNPDQRDVDLDGAGDLCDICPYQRDFLNSDEDEFPDCLDNCRLVTNPDQADDDYDSVGNACDNCPDQANSDQADADQDGNGDLCDICPGYDDFADFDADTVPDSCDNCPEDANADQLDSDDDGIGDMCELICGDANDDRSVNVGDAVFVINLIFHDGPGPDPYEAGDVNCDTSVNVGDAVYLINFVFNEGAPVPCAACP